MSGPYQRSREVRMVRRKDDARKVSKEAKHFDLDYTLNFLIRKVIRRSCPLNYTPSSQNWIP